MLCIWLGMQAGYRAGNPRSSSDFTFTLSKTTCSEEVKNGADLELIVTSPLGQKRCLIQAKVLDPTTGLLRCHTVTGLRKLRSQLVAARKDAGDLAFLLVYVPGRLLDGGRYDYSTYEQGNHFDAVGSIPSYYGATFIAVNDLLGKSGRWRNTKQKVPQSFPGSFKSGVPFVRLFLELLLCRRSSWRQPGSKSDEISVNAFRTLSVGASDITIDEWIRIQNSADQWIPRDLDDQEGDNEA